MFNLRRVSIGLLVAVVLVAGFTLALAAQGEENGEPLNPVEDVPVGETGGEETTTDLGNGEPDGAPAQAPEGPSNNPNMLTFYKRFSANTFTAYDDNATWEYYGAGCIYRTAGDPWYEHDMQLPDGAVINQMTLYFYDNSAAQDAEVHLFAFDGSGGGSSSIATVSSAGTPGQSAITTNFSHPVDNVGEALSVRLDYNGGTDSSLRICGVRFRYQYSLNTNLPVIMNNVTP